MSTVEIVGAIIGVLIVAVTLWKIFRNGVAKGNGEIPKPDTSWGIGGN